MLYHLALSAVRSPKTLDIGIAQKVAIGATLCITHIYIGTYLQTQCSQP